MNQYLLPPASIGAAFEQAARAQDARQGPQGASRQIAPAQDATPVERAIADAARQTSIDFDYLIAQAQVESAMDPRAQASTSSASGLYQFVESTWLGTMRRHGDRFGLGDVAQQIDLSSSGEAYVADPAARTSILALRNDPKIASLMAAGLAEDNRAYLAPVLGRQPEHNELYLAHFLGAGGAARFLSAMAEDPGQSAAALFRRPAAANRSVFFQGNGEPRSLSGVMNYLSARLDRARADVPTSARSAYAAASLAPPFPASSGYGQPPYIIADESVFGPQSPPVVTGAGRSRVDDGQPLSLFTSGSQTPMSAVLQRTFSLTTAEQGGQSGAQVRRAYDQLKAIGL